MQNFLLRTLFTITIAWNLAGCPVQTELTDLTGGSLTGGTANNANSAASRAGNTAIDGFSNFSNSTNAISPSSSVTSDDLTDRFPGCQSPTEEDTWRAQILMLVNRERTTAGFRR